MEQNSKEDIGITEKLDPKKASKYLFQKIRIR